MHALEGKRHIALYDSYYECINVYGVFNLFVGRSQVDCCIGDSKYCSGGIIDQLLLFPLFMYNFNSKVMKDFL